MAKTSAKQQAANNFDTLFGARQGERIVSGGFKMLAHSRITVRPQVRRTFPKAEIEELQGSIRELRTQQGGIEGTGVLQALLVCPEGNGYRLIAGEKRFRATQAEGLSEVPCIVVPAVSEGMIRLLQLTENALRTPPPVLDEAQAMQETMDEQKLSLRDLARLLGKTLGYVTNRLNLLKMAPDIQEMVSRRGDTLKHAPLIEAAQDKAQRRELIRAVVEEQLSVKELERRLNPEKENSSGFQSDITRRSHISGVSPQGQGEAYSETDNEVFSRENSSTPDHEGTTSHQGGGNSANTTRPDPIASALQPASSFIAEAERQLKALSLSPDYKTEVRRQIERMEKQLARIRKVVD
jgi:ParB/RepB/Spo0J family partition protein